MRPRMPRIKPRAPGRKGGCPGVPLVCLTWPFRPAGPLHYRVMSRCWTAVTLGTPRTLRRPRIPVP